MINARSLATLGIGFGVAAIATLGFITETQPQPVVTTVFGVSFPDNPLRHVPNLKAFTDDDRTIINFIVHFVVNQ